MQHLRGTCIRIVAKIKTAAKSFKAWRTCLWTLSHVRATQSVVEINDYVKVIMGHSR